MIKLKCHTSVIMHPTGEIAFKAGEEYWFHIKANGNIERFADNCLHKFMAVGPQAWSVYFQYELDGTLTTTPSPHGYTGTGSDYLDCILGIGGFEEYGPIKMSPEK